MSGNATTYQYRVDESDRIVGVCHSWLAFARENGAPELTTNRVTGRSLWDFVACNQLTCLYQAIHREVRRSGKPAVLPMDCDSPSLKRTMQITIRREACNHLVYEATLLRIQPHDHFEIINSDRAHSDAMLTLCSVCKRGLLETDGWLEVADLGTRLSLFRAKELPGLRHSLCPDCAKQLGALRMNESAA